MKKFAIFFSITLAIAIWIAAYSHSPANLSRFQAQDKLILTGSSTVAPLAVELAKYYESEHPSIKISVQTGGSSKGITDVRQGIADIGMVSRSLKAEEKDLLVYPIARDGISILVNRKNPVESLTSSQIVDIYTDQINNWKQVGGQDAPITVISKQENHSTLELFANYFKLKITDIRADATIGDNQETIAAVINNPNVIAYVSIGSAEYEIVRGMPLKLLPIKGIDATIANINNRTFPLARPLNLVVKTAPKGLTKDFIDFAQSEKATPIVKRQAFVPIFP